MINSFNTRQRYKIAISNKTELNSLYICPIKNGSVAQLNRALDFGSSGYRFESCRGHKETKKAHPTGELFLLTPKSSESPKLSRDFWGE